MRNQDGFTLVELIIGVAIVGLLTTAMASALIVTLRTTGVTNKRMSESHDVQITSAYLANDVQSAASVTAGSGGNCSGAFTTLATFTYATSGNPNAVYKCGTAPNGETQVTRTFAGGTPIVVAHFAGAARPTVTVTYDPAQPTVPVSVTMVFTKASDCTLDCTYTLFGSRRSFNPPATTVGDPPVGDVVLLSTGASSPLWVQGSCPSGGTDPAADCFSDPQSIGLPISPDIATSGWTPTPSSPTTLFDKLNDRSDATWISTISQNQIAKFYLPPLNPPGGTNPTVELRAASAGAAAKLKIHIYDSTTMQQLVASGNINVNSSLDNSGNWLLSDAERSSIPDAAYQHLALGIEMTNNKSVSVYGLAVNNSAPGLLTIKGPLLVNAPISSAVRLTGTKSANKLQITNGGDFKIWNPGACSGCNNQTVTCGACTWVGQQPWTNYQQSIPDPLRALPDPPVPSTNGTCNSGVCTPGNYPTGLSLTSATALQQGTYYLGSPGLSLSGTAKVTCVAPCANGVFLYIAGGSVSLTGQSAVNLTPPNSGVYKGIVMFQARSDTNALKFAGNSGSTTFCTMGGLQYGNCLNGIVYVPNATQVTLATGSASLAAKAIVAQNVKVSSSVTIG
jgi:prepilin-type N-terminal cleavage/methylation domain-containing protein